MSIKHLKVSAKADGPDPGNVHASDWNAAHDLSALVAQDVSDFAEAVDDRVSALLKQGANVTLTYDDAANTLTIAASGGAATTPGGATTQLQFNDAGAFAGDADLVWDKTGNVLTLNGTLKGATNIKVQPGATGDILLDGGRGAALSPTATSGFVTLPTTTAPPTGVPVNALTGAAPTVYDATNNKLWFYLKGSASVVTWNPADKSPNCILSNGNLTTSSSTSDNGPARATVGKSSGKWAWETRYDSGVTPIFGIGLSSVPLTDFPGYNPNSWSFYGKTPAEKITSGVHTAYGSPFATTHIVTTLLDMDAGTLEWWLDGVTMGVAFTGLTGTIYPMIGSSGSGVSVSTTNFGATAFTYALPVGFAGIGGTGAAGGWVTPTPTPAKTTIDDTAPTAPAYGDRWIKPSNMSEMVWVPNAGSSGIWINPADAAVAATFPLAIAKGGTGATTAPAALLNLGVTNAAGQNILGDGTVAAPGLAFNSEPGLGWYRVGAGNIGMTSGGGDTVGFDCSTAALSFMTVFPRSAGGTGQINLYNQPKGTANRNALSIIQNADGNARIATAAAGTATRGNLTLDAPQVTTTGSLSTLAGVTLNAGNLFVAAGSAVIANSTGAGGGSIQLAENAAASRYIRCFAANIDFLSANASIVTHQFQNNGDAGKAAGGTTWIVLSDKRAKTDIEDWDGGLDKVLSLRPRRFTRIDTGERSIGCIADEAETGFGELITRSPGKVGDTEYSDLAKLGIDPLFWALVNSVKTLHERLSHLELHPA